MPSRIRGITVEIGGDTTKLDKALRTTDSNLSRVQKDLRDVDRLLKLDPSNTELLAQKQRLLAERAELAAQRVSMLEEAAGKLDDTLEKSKLDDFNLELDLTKARAENAARELKDFDPSALTQVSDAADDAARSLDDVDGSAGGLEEGFSIAGGAIANFAGGAMTKLLDIGLQVLDTLWNLDEATEEYRQSMAMLNTAYETAGFSGETAKQAYQGFYEILGDTGQATEASQLLAQLATNEQDVAKWVEIAAGVYGTFGESIPIESLIEAANETAKTGEVTGVLADALNWVGLSEEQVTEQLSLMGDETSRSQYLMGLLSRTYEEATDSFYKNNEAIIESRQAQTELDESMAVLGQSVADLKSQFMESFGPYLSELAKVGAAAIDFVADAVAALGDALDWLGDKINGVISWFKDLFNVGNSASSMDVPSTDTRTVVAADSYNIDPRPFSPTNNFPAFASGGLIPPNNPFLAVLGDNRREPEVVAPYSAIKQATSDAIAERGGASSQLTLIVKATDGFTRNLSISLDEESRRRGVKLVNDRR